MKGCRATRRDCWGQYGAGEMQEKQVLRQDKNEKEMI
jgi:hypothetical protein